ncbi:hypothetical protein IWQ60_004321 [Tieghemiomyces parasiticus]|uniref:Complex 1 LYR protein n=1 Tax=Tieghemiomyces parasiticus TaxID=78921 RepID=A0A9W8AEI3_9FUNG|nr:hypothetical protein IWQ60_004321 [Tieghemiomyces parasiticus]
MATSGPSARHLYRGLLREIHKLYRSPASREVAHQELVSRFAKHSQVVDPIHLQMVRRDAQDTLTYMNGTRRHKELDELYNPNRNITEGERIGLSAKRVGLSLPKLGRTED